MLMVELYARGWELAIEGVGVGSRLRGSQEMVVAPVAATEGRREVDSRLRGSKSYAKVSVIPAFPGMTEGAARPFDRPFDKLRTGSG